MSNSATKTYLVSVIERAIAYYKVEAGDARTAAENWQEGEFHDRDDEALDSDGPCNVREQQPDGTWRKVAPSDWQVEPPADAVEHAVLLSALKALRLAERYLADDLDESDAMEMHVYNAILDAKAAAESALSAAGESALPAHGNQPYSVLLLYPDYASEQYGTETYYAFVEASDPFDAVAVAQRQAVAAQEAEIDDPTDFAPLLVTKGHHHGEASFDK